MALFLTDDRVAFFTNTRVMSSLIIQVLFFH